MFNETRFLLSERNNPNSAIRANGVRWWGYPSRQGSITCIVIHTTENNAANGAAMNVARWQSTTAPAPSSYHKMVDTHNIVQTVLDNHTAFHAVNFNARGLGLSFATRAAAWGNNAAADTRMLERGAWVAAQWCKRYSIPVRWISRAQGVQGVKGLITHANVDPGRRSDPGARFPATRFLNLVKQYMDDKPEPKLDEWEVFWMSLNDKEKKVLKEFASQLAGPDGVDNGASFARQFLAFNREERGRLREFLDAIDEMDSSTRGQGRALSAMWREAGARGWLRDIERFKENRDYDHTDLNRK